MIVDPFEWKARVCYQGRCQFTGWDKPCDGPIQAAHVISKQALKRRGLQAFLWDVRNGVAACYQHHRRSDSGHARFPREMLPAAAEEFARELDLDWWLDRFYPSSDVLPPGA